MSASVANARLSEEYGIGTMVCPCCGGEWRFSDAVISSALREIEGHEARFDSPVQTLSLLVDLLKGN